MSDDEFGFTDEAANREVDAFAEMSDEEFRYLVDLSTEVMNKQGVTDRSEAIEVAKQLKETFDRRVMPGSGRVGLRKYGVEEFRRLVMRELTDGKEPCLHGHIEPITFCGTCEKQARIDRHVQNPAMTNSRKPCTHTRVDLPPFDSDEEIPPCAACKADEEDELEGHLNERNKWAANLKKAATTPPSKPVDHLQQLWPNTGPKGPLYQRLQDREAEMNALIGLLLDKLGGEISLGPEEMEHFKELVRQGEAAYSVEPSVTAIELIVRREGPTGRVPFWRYSITPARVNPSAVPPSPVWMTAADGDDDEDLPF